MKKITLLSILTLVFFNNLLSQTPNLMSYQAVIWDASGNLVSEKMVSIKISILQGSVSGTSVYAETHRIQTNANGLVSLTIGGGTNATGKIADINWGGGSYFLKTETDPTGGVNFSITGITQLVSVPYSLYSGIAGNISTKNTGLPGQTLTIDKDGKMTWLSNIPTISTTSIADIKPIYNNFVFLHYLSVSGGNILADGGSPITARGVVWSTSTNQTIALTTKTSNGTGTGSFTSNLTFLTPKTTYYVRAYATNSAGTGYGNEISITTPSDTSIMGIPCPGTPNMKDIDGNTYNTVQIGTQCWTNENLRVTKYRDGTIIPLDESGGTTGGGTGETWRSRTTGARTVHGHNATNLATYGYLYNWYAVADTKGLCPSGWHVPSDSEWTTLTTYLGGGSVAGGKMKSTGTTYWNSPNTGATNESGFSVLPGGQRIIDGRFDGIRNYAFFWSATESGNTLAWYHHLYHSHGGFGRLDNSQMIYGFSVRCLRN